MRKTPDVKTVAYKELMKFKEWWDHGLYNTHGCRTTWKASMDADVREKLNNELKRRATEIMVLARQIDPEYLTITDDCYTECIADSALIGAYALFYYAVDNVIYANALGELGRHIDLITVHMEQ